MNLIAQVFSIFLIPKTRLLKSFRGTVLEHPLAGNVSTGPEHCRNLERKHLYHFFHYCEMSAVVKFLSLSDNKS